MNGNAQTPFFKTHHLGETYRNAKVELVYEDQNSLLWFGTSEGLFAYDGINFISYLKSDTTSNHVRAIYQDTEGVLWTGYQDGSIFQLKNQQLQVWQPEEGTPAVAITGFAEDQAGRLWIATYGEGVYYKSERHLYNIDTADGLLGADIYVICSDLSGKIWLGTDGGISICSVQNNEKQIKNLTRQDGLPDDIVREMIMDERGNFWIGMYDGGVCYFDIQTQQFEYPVQQWDKGIVGHLELFEGHELWIGTEGNGLWVLSLKEGSLRRLAMEDKWQHAKIYDLHKDVEGNIWIVSNTYGICHANRQFEWLETDLEPIQSILADSDNQIWLGTQDGLFAYHMDSLGSPFFRPYLADLDLNVISLYEDEFQNLWIGTFGEGVYIFNKNTQKYWQLSEKDGLTNGSILSIAGVNKQVWLATLGGVTELDLKQDILKTKKIQSRNFNQENGLGTNFIYKVFIDSQERTWFATDGKGISVLENGIIKNFQTASPPQAQGTGKGLKLKTVYSITEDHRGHIWLSTAKEGIFEFDGENFNHLTIKEGLRHPEITSLVSDEKGNILMMHPKGIDILTPETRHIIYYDEEVGIQHIDPNLNAVCTDQNGQIWLGGKNGLVKYIPLNETLEIHPRTRLNTVSIFLEPINHLANNVFAYDQNHLVFDYLGLWYTAPETVKYKYRLIGYNEHWIETQDRKVTYSNLPANSYTFEVASTENETWLDEPVVSYSFQIKSPFWGTWWFILMAIIIVITLFFWYQKQRDRRLQRVNLLQKEKVESQFEALKSQINPHFLFNSFNTLAAIIEENPPVAVEYVEKLADFYRCILQYRDKEVIALQEEIELINNYNFLLKKRFGDNFKLDIQTNGQLVFVVPLALQMLVENAIKHNVVSKSKPLNIHINIDESKDFITVSNNLQPKMQPEKSTQFGLQSLEKRYALLSGQKIKIEETKHTFKVSLPIIY